MKRKTRSNPLCALRRNGNKCRYSHIIGVSKNSALKLLAEAGEACSLYQDSVMRNLNRKRVECDEICSFVGMKQKNVPEELQGEFG